MEPRISIVTLGVDELERAARFYEAMGLERHRKFTDGVAFFQMGGMILALWPRQELARDVGEQHFSAPGPQSAGQCGTVLAYNARTEEETHEILARAQRAGGRILKPAERAFWGGMQGYFADTEGNMWEVAHNPDFPIDAEGRISLPE